MTAIMKLRNLMLTLLAALGLTVGGMATASAGDMGNADGAIGDAPETVQWDDDDNGEDEGGDDDWGDDSEDDSGDSDW